MQRRDLLKAALIAPLLPFRAALASKPFALAAERMSRVRPGDPGWPSKTQWDGLRDKLDGQLLRLQSPFTGCEGAAKDSACKQALAHLDNPYALGDQPALTQTSGWLDAWTSQPSAYAVAAHNASDVAAAVDFARRHRLRLIVKGGGHSYQGRSDAPDSLLVWTRHMNDVALHEAFVGQGCAGRVAPQPAASMGAGAMWIDAYDAVTTRGGRYVQGGGCTTVGVAGLVQSGGFGSFSKNWGTVASGLLEAEIVTADGKVRIANACTHPDLFWALKGGGGGSFGVVTRVTLRTHPLPETFGGAFGAIRASSDRAWRDLIDKALAFYQQHLFNPHWGEQMVFRSGRLLQLSMVFQGMDQAQAAAIWAPFVDWVGQHEGCSFEQPFQTISVPARHFWDAAYFRTHDLAGLMLPDDRPGAPRDHVFWAGDHGQVGWFIHSFQSIWLPESLLQEANRARLRDALIASSHYWDVQLHFNKGLAGAPGDMRAQARDTATHPGMADAFALAIIAGNGGPAFPGMPGNGPDRDRGRKEARLIDKAMAALQGVAPGAGSYLSESDYFLSDWQRAYWGPHYSRLAAIKRKYDPQDLFIVHHGIGSEAWSKDGFSPTT